MAKKMFMIKNGNSWQDDNNTVVINYIRNKTNIKYK